jgi:hypothetical protein
MRVIDASRYSRDSCFDREKFFKMLKFLVQEREKKRIYIPLKHTAFQDHGSKVC